MTTDNEDVFLWENWEGRAATIIRDQFERDIGTLYLQITDRNDDSGRNPGEELVRIVEENGPDYCAAVATAVAQVYASFTLTHPDTIEVSLSLIQYGLFIAAYRSLVPPTTTTEKESA